MDKELTERIGQRLRALRHARDLSLSGLAARTASLSKSRISNYEQGIRRMGIEQARELAQALGGVTACYLLCLEDIQSLAEAELALLDHYRQADEQGREAILRVAKAQATDDAQARARRNGGPRDHG